MRVLIVGHSLVNPLNRARVAALARHEDLTLQVLTPHRWTGRHGEEYVVAEQPAGDGYRLSPHRVFFRGANRQHVYLYGPGLTRVIRDYAPDLVHIEEEPYSLVTFQLARAAERLRVRWLLTSFQNLDKRYPPPFCCTQSWVLKRAHGALAGSPATERVLRARGFAGRAAPVALGVDPAVYAPGSEPALATRLGLSGFVAGYVGRFERVKGLDGLLRALAAVPACTLLMVGAGPDEAALRTLARELGVDARIVWVPTVTHLEVPRHLRVMDCLVLPSVTTPTIQEQFGRVLVEAMACGVPVIGSSSGAIPAVIGDAGLVFPEGDSTALARCLGELASSPERRAAFAAAGRARALSTYTWDAIARGIAALYREVLQ